MNFSSILLMCLLSFLICKIHNQITLRTILIPLKKFFCKTKKEWNSIDVDVEK